MASPIHIDRTKETAFLELMAHLGVAAEDIYRALKDADFARSLADLLITGTALPSSQLMAMEVMRRQFFGMADWAHHFGVRFPPREVVQSWDGLWNFPWPKEILMSPDPVWGDKRVFETHIAYPSLIEPRGSDVGTLGWWLNQRFPNEREPVLRLLYGLEHIPSIIGSAVTPPAWRLLRLAPVPCEVGPTTPPKVPEGYRMATLAEVVTGLLCHYWALGSVPVPASNQVGITADVVSATDGGEFAGASLQVTWYMTWQVFVSARKPERRTVNNYGVCVCRKEP